MKNTISFSVYGRYALFTDPVTKLGGEKCTYQVPTYESLKGICRSIYWKPTIVWVIDRVRIIKPIQTQSKGIKPLDYAGGQHSLAIYNYLQDVAYQVEAHFEWNLNLPELARDRIDGKHYQVAHRMLDRGGRQDVFLGTRDCPAYVEPCSFGEGPGHYDDIPELTFGLMVHGFDYPTETGLNELHTRLWHSKMQKGVIHFPRPDDPSLIRRFVREMTPEKNWELGSNILGAEQEACL